ncbi:MAG: CGNR zinc finger domain-containing protein [Cyanobacteria bacterium]|nr:CGNR zinc finger domain-containing protein [Cyanobacteriota bacterium]
MLVKSSPSPLKGLTDFPPGFLFLSNHPALDLLNTELNFQDSGFDLIQTPEELLRWLLESKLVTPETYQETSQQLGILSEVQKSCLMNHFATCRRLFRDVLQSEGAEPALSDFNRFIQDFPLTKSLVLANDTTEHVAGVSIQETSTLPFPMNLLHLVIAACLDCLTRVALSRIHQCENEACVLLFWDTSKNQTRRWCSMDLCGNRMKVAAFRERHKSPRKK